MLSKKSSHSYRHELKFIVDKKTIFLLEQRLKDILTYDQFCQPRSYRVTSLYFDDYRLSAFYDKINGLADRTKYRLRTYNLNPHALNFEAKIKKNDLVRKESFPCTPSQYQQILCGQFSFAPQLLGQYLPLVQKLKFLQPKIVVDYDRTAFVYPAGNVRLTLDQSLQASTSSWDFLHDQQQLYQRVFPHDETIFEIKFDQYLPQLIRQLLAEFPLFPLASSKYVLSQQLLRNRYQSLHNNFLESSYA